jgi:glutathione S-transferase
MTPATTRLHWHPLSGHSHRAQLMLSLLDREFDLIEVDVRSGAHKAPAFVQLSPFGQVPVLESEGEVIADSNAILVYLAIRYDTSGRWYPRDAVGGAKVQRWLSVAAGQLAAGPMAARLANVFGLPIDQAKAQAGAAALFSVMEAELARGPFLVGHHPTIADVALYTYTAHAPEGGIALEPYPAIRAWIGRIEGLPGFVPMAKTTVAA